MNKNYIIPIIVLIGLSLALLLLPEKKFNKEMAPEELLMQINSTSRFITPDIVADRIIKKDPAMILVDVRSPEEYIKYSLPGSMNIPLSSLADSTTLDILGQEALTGFCSLMIIFSPTRPGSLEKDLDSGICLSCRAESINGLIIFS